MPYIKANHHIWHNGEKFIPGQTIKNIDEKSAKRLVESDAAFFVDQQPLLLSENVPPKSPENTPSLEDDPREVINEEYNLEELKDTATSFGMDFPANTTKKALMDQIFTEGKEQQFIDLLEDDE